MLGTKFPQSLSFSMEIHQVVAFVAVAIFIIIIFTINYCNGAKWFCGDGYDFHSGGVRFKPRPEQLFTD
jgi:hypothetical protein